jgi:hypothetical protein
VDALNIQEPNLNELGECRSIGFIPKTPDGFPEFARRSSDPTIVVALEPTCQGKKKGASPHRKAMPSGTVSNLNGPKYEVAAVVDSLSFLVPHGHRAARKDPSLASDCSE